MRKCLYILVLCIGLSFFQANLFADKDTNGSKAVDIVLAADKYRGEASWGGKIEVVDMLRDEKGEPKVLSTQTFLISARLFGKYPSGAFKAFVQFAAPQSEVGKKMLMDGRIYWMFFPKTNNLVRITPAQRLAGLATAADIASTDFATDYNAELIGGEKVLDEVCHKLKLTPKEGKEENVAYGSLVYWVSRKSNEPVKAEYYGATGNLLKTAYFRDFKIAPFLGKVKTHEIFMADALQKGRVTRIFYKDLRQETRPDYYFNKDNLQTSELTGEKSVLAPEDIVRNADSYRSSDNWGFDLHVVDMERQADQKVPKILSEHKFKGTARIFGSDSIKIAKCLCLFTEPESEKGKRMLMDGNIYWLFFPNTKNLVRITPAQRLAGLASAADIAGTNFASYYDSTFASPSSQKVLEKDCYALVLQAKKDMNVAYHKILYWIEKETFKPVQAEYYSETGKHLKTAYYRSFKTAEGLKAEKAHELFIVDPLQKGRVTRMIYDNLKTEEAPEYMFRKEEMGNR